MKNSNLLRMILSVLAVGFLSSASYAQILIDDGKGESSLPSSSPNAVHQENQAPAADQSPSFAPAEKHNSGEGAARQYFLERKQRGTSMGGARAPSSVGGGGSGSRYMALQAGTFVNDKQYRWGNKDHASDVGDLILSVSYRMGQWQNSMDLLLRTEFTTYDIDGQSPKKLSILPVITFPDVESDFPLYFGAGAGAGIFFKQVNSESDLSLDYQLIVGGRFLNMWENGGLVVETGLKGSVFLASSGQFNGVFITAGAGFTF
jgi:hypothetical protein